MSNWLTEARNRLVAAGFAILDDVPFNGRTFKTVARRSRFELTKFGFYETFFVFAEFSTLNTDVMRPFSADAFRCAKQHKKIPLPCGLFEGVCCFAIAVTQAVDEATQQSVRNEKPPKHWAAGEIPVVYDQVQGKLYYFERTPLWGAAYYAGFRGQIEQFLGKGAKT
jgi:hypothetical protein